jgi:hypothetical protein
MVQGCCLLQGQTLTKERSCRVLLHPMVKWRHGGTQTEMTSRYWCGEAYIASVSVPPSCALGYMDEGVGPNEDARSGIHHGRTCEKAQGPLFALFARILPRDRETGRGLRPGVRGRVGRSRRTQRRQLAVLVRCSLSAVPAVSVLSSQTRTVALGSTQTRKTCRDTSGGPRAPSRAAGVDGWTFSRSDRVTRLCIKLAKGLGYMKLSRQTSREVCGHEVCSGMRLAVVSDSSVWRDKVSALYPISPLVTCSSCQESRRDALRLT